MAVFPAYGQGQGQKSVSSKGKEKRQRAENWTWEETVCLVEAKRQEWEEKENGSLIKFTTTTDKWAKVQEYMKASSLFRARSVEQIRQKWEALYNSWKKIKVTNNEVGSIDYWMMSKEEKIEKRLPTSFDRRLWDMLNSFLGQKNVSRNTKCFDTMVGGVGNGGGDCRLTGDGQKGDADLLGEDLNEANGGGPGEVGAASLSDDVSTNPNDDNEEKRGGGAFGTRLSGRRPFEEGDLLRSYPSGGDGGGGGGTCKRRKNRGPDAFLELMKESNKCIVEALGKQREDKREELKLLLALEERKLQVEERKLDMEIRDRESVGRDRDKMANALCSIIDVLDKIAEKI